MSNNFPEQQEPVVGLAACDIIDKLETADFATVQANIQVFVDTYKEYLGIDFFIVFISERYYYRAQNAKRHSNHEYARQNFLSSIALIENSILGIVDSEPNEAVMVDDLALDYPMLSEASESTAWYLLGLNYWQLGNWLYAADAFMNSIDANPDHRHAGSMHWMVSHCYEKLKQDSLVSAEEADAVIEWGYKTLFDEYPYSRDVEYAVLQLGKIHLARGEPILAGEYFNWFLDLTHADNGQIADIGQILERMEGCSR